MAEDPKRRRLQSQTDRDIESEAARRERESAAAPEASWDDNYTDRYEAGEIDEEELQAGRDGRPTPSRLSKLEQGHHQLVREVAGLRGGQKAQGVLLRELHDDMKARRADDADAKKNARERVTKVIGGLASGGVVLAVLHKLGVL